MLIHTQFWLRFASTTFFFWQINLMYAFVWVRPHKKFLSQSKAKRSKMLGNSYLFMLWQATNAIYFTYLFYFYYFSIGSKFIFELYIRLLFTESVKMKTTKQKLINIGKSTEYKAFIQTNRVFALLRCQNKNC